MTRRSQAPDSMLAQNQEIQITMHRAKRSSLVLIAAIACVVALLGLSARSASAVCPAHDGLPFGVTEGCFDGSVTADDTGDVSFTQAGGHPYAVSTSIQFNTNPHPVYGPLWPSEPIKDVFVDAPAGLVGNPTGVAECSLDQLIGTKPNDYRPECPPASQVGVATLSPAGSPDFPAPIDGFLSGAFVDQPLYNMTPPPGVPARFALKIAGTVIALDAEVHGGSEYRVAINARNAPELLPILGTTVTLWGVPADSSHTPLRWCSGKGVEGPRCEAGVAPSAFLSLPTSCKGPLTTNAQVDSWFDPGDFKDASFISHLTDAEGGAPQGVTDCDPVPFDPDISVEPTSNRANAPTGLKVDLSVAQDSITDPDGLAPSHLKKAVVQLPEGMRVNPSSADGLGACSSAQIELGNDDQPSCPDSAKIGSLTVDTPLLDDQLTGSVYLARQGDNPFNSLLAIYLVAEGNGVLVKLAGHVQADPETGRLSTVFDNQPEVPFSHLHLELKGGSRAPLTNPGCGAHVVESALTPWARPNSPVDLPHSFDITTAADGGPCKPAGFDPSFTAGVTNPLSGDFSPFVAQIQRGVDDRELGRINMTLPQGSVADLSDIAVCGEAELAAAASKSGVATQAAPACPAASQVGTTTVGAGSGGLFYPLIPGSGVSGRVFLTGPHTASQFSRPGALQAAYGLAIEVPAVAGPFDLGTVLVRAAIYVDSTTAQLTVLSDRLPRILQGIPLDVRDVQVNVDREKFTTNPTSCAQMSVLGDIHAQDGAAASRSSAFQVGECSRLALTPRMTIGLTGRKQTRTGGHPGLTARLTQPARQTNIKRVQVKLPKSIALDPKNANNAGLLCGYESGLAADCPASSVIGQATAVSPLLKRPLRGKVHFVQGIRFDPETGNRIRTLPTLLVKLRGEVALNVRATTNAVKGQLVTTFPIVPDAQVSSFKLSLKGGKRKGILTATGRPNLCNTTQRAGLAINAHNGKQNRQAVTIKTPCAKRGSKRKRR